MVSISKCPVHKPAIIGGGTWNEREGWPIQTTIITFIFDVIMDQFSSIWSVQCPRHHPAAADSTVHHFHGDPMQCSAQCTTAEPTQFSNGKLWQCSSNVFAYQWTAIAPMIREALEAFCGDGELYWDAIKWTYGILPTVWHYPRRMANGLINNRNWMDNFKYFMSLDSIRDPPPTKLLHMRCSGKWWNI